jgi:predicted kinase
MKLYMMKGLPGSGKSTWAKNLVATQPDWVRINKDDLRSMFAAKFTSGGEKRVLFYRDLMVEMELAHHNRNVVVDDTNLHPKHETKLRAIASAVGAEFEVIDFTGVGLEHCIKQDLQRIDSVGAKVIKDMYRRYLAPRTEKPVFDIRLPHAIICDIDGTLALHNGRSPYDTAKCEGDLVNPDIAAMVRMHDAWGMKVILVTGRDQEFHDHTVRWLEKYGIPFDLLYMRKLGDKTRDNLVKQEIYDTYIKGRYNILFVLDDRNRVVDQWRQNGLTCLQVAEGDF